jgi:hypothetical protein
MCGDERDELVGMDIDYAREVYANWKIRVVDRDNEAVPITDDLQADRINVHVRKNIITYIKGNG